MFREKLNNYHIVVDLILTIQGIQVAGDNLQLFYKISVSIIVELRRICER